MTHRGWVLSAVLFAALPACGGQTITSGASSGGSGGSGATGGSGGASAAGGSSGTGGSSGSGGTSGASGAGATGGSGGGPTACVMGGACTGEGQICTPPGCCPCSYVCQNGTWQAGACPACPAPSCPQTLPNDGDPCDPCTDPVGTDCAYASCGPEAICDGQHWHIVIATCPPPIPCGANTGGCPLGELCVYPGGLGAQPTCAINPCAPSEPVTCACAGTLCDPGSMCSGTTPDSVSCSCPNC